MWQVDTLPTDFRRDQRCSPGSNRGYVVQISTDVIFTSSSAHSLSRRVGPVRPHPEVAGIDTGSAGIPAVSPLPLSDRTGSPEPHRFDSRTPFDRRNPVVGPPDAPSGLGRTNGLESNRSPTGPNSRERAVTRDVGHERRADAGSGRFGYGDRSVDESGTEA